MSVVAQSVKTYVELMVTSRCVSFTTPCAVYTKWHSENSCPWQETNKIHVLDRKPTKFMSLVWIQQNSCPWQESNKIRVPDRKQTPFMSPIGIQQNSRPLQESNKIHVPVRNPTSGSLARNRHPDWFKMLWTFMRSQNSFQNMALWLTSGTACDGQKPPHIRIVILPNSREGKN